MDSGHQHNRTSSAFVDVVDRIKYNHPFSGEKQHQINPDQDCCFSMHADLAPNSSIPTINLNLLYSGRQMEKKISTNSGLLLWQLATLCNPALRYSWLAQSRTAPPLPRPGHRATLNYSSCNHADGCHSPALMPVASLMGGMEYQIPPPLATPCRVCSLPPPPPLSLVFHSPSSFPTPSSFALSPL